MRSGSLLRPSRRARRGCPALLLALALRVATPGDGPAPGPVLPEAAPPAGETELVPDVPLSQLRRDPRPRLGRRVRFVLQYRGTESAWNPYLTRFGPGEWIALSGWPDERFTWERAVFADPMRRLFLRRGSALAALVDELRPHERFEVVGTVRELQLGEPWIEVESLTPRLEMVGPGVIHHVLRAEEAAEEGKWSLAADQLERALAGPLPARPRAELERRRDVARARLEATQAVASPR